MSPKAGYLRQWSRPNRQALGSLFSSRRQVGSWGLDKLVGLPATRETPRQGEFDKSGWCAFFSFASRPKNRFGAFLPAPRGVVTADKTHVPQDSGSPT
ncbi:hypothetical protein [Spirosoma linguale]|uniref:hypothetical protein n=1 Tax=Spirosoma linguale TaxID=108 RepID=UPI003CC7F1C5